MRQQCELLGLARSALYYEPVPDSDLNLQLMRLIDEQYLIRPYFGQRRMTIWLRQQGHPVNVKRVRRLMQIMGLEAIHNQTPLTYSSPKLVQSLGSTSGASTSISDIYHDRGSVPRISQEGHVQNLEWRDKIWAVS